MLIHCVLQEMLKEDVACEPAAMNSEDVLFLLYTSGSTGKPKGLVHTQAGYLLYAALTQRVTSRHAFSKKSIKKNKTTQPLSLFRYMNLLSAS